jgi:hypothetical protein
MDIIYINGNITIKCTILKIIKLTKLETNIFKEQKVNLVCTFSSGIPSTVFVQYAIVADANL